MLLLWLFALIILPSLVVTTIEALSSEPKIVVYNYKLQQEKELNLEEYVTGVIAAEMPVSFPLAALKSQAVAARTYALKKKSNGQRLTTTSRFDQAWLSKNELLNSWQLDKFLLRWCKLAAAVDQTKGLVLTYNNQLITAAYHSTSGGQTADAVEVWGGDVPYLKSVSSYCESNSPYYNQQQFFSWSQLAEKLDLLKDNYSQIKVLKYSSSGRILKIRIADKNFSGRDLRRKLGLNSTKFKFKTTKLGVRFIVDGFGHGVGMSQYGAQGLAEQGYNFKQILNHYYPQTELVIGKY